MKKTLKYISYLLLILVLVFTGFLILQTVTEYKPADSATLLEYNTAETISDTIDLVTWNVGYFGLGAEMDFFYEGGTMVRPDKERYATYKDRALERLKSFYNADFILIQEVDSFAKRSWYDNQIKAIDSVLPSFYYWFGMNYNAWVPVPLTEPMGRVNAGIFTWSRHFPSSVKKYAFESSYAWPMRLFQLKRVFLELRIKTMNGKELILINTHNSAFEDAATLREAELKKLKTIMLEEYNKGNYVIVGGDWNQNPIGYDTADLLPVYNGKYIKPGIPHDYLPADWNYAFDKLHTTNRDVNKPYTEGVTHTSLIDFFITSPNIEVLDVKVIPTKFIESDHQPVTLKVVLK